MTGRLAVDFGTSNTVLAVWNPSSRQGEPLHIPQYGRQFQQAGEQISVIPSLIHYGSENRRWIGQQVLDQNLYQSNHTFRWMKRYITQRSPIKVNIEGKSITPFQAGQDFLSTVLLFARQEINLEDEEVAFCAPVEAYEHYENWLSGVAEAAKMPRFRLIDEPSAAALGYGAHIQPGSVYLIFDFGGGTLHASVVMMEAQSSQTGGQRCRVLGKAWRFIGGSNLDQWLFEEVLRLNQRKDYDEDTRRISNAILVECEHAKEKLSFEEQAAITVMDPASGTLVSAELTRQRFEELLDQHNLFNEINQVVRSALTAAHERGYTEDNIQAALLVGGSSQIPSVQRTLRQIFGRERVFSNRPLDAVARGAAAFVAGVDYFDHIQHDYAIRYYNPAKNCYDYRVIVPRGTPYPTESPVERLSIKASHEMQRQLGLQIYEMGEQRTPVTQPFELVFDPSGAARITPVTPADQEQRSLFWMNERSPTFLVADPPGAKGEARFEVEFWVDANKRLTITARDLKTGQLSHRNYPVVKLT